MELFAVSFFQLRKTSLTSNSPRTPSPTLQFTLLSQLSNLLSYLEPPPPPPPCPPQGTRLHRPCAHLKECVAAAVVPTSRKALYYALNFSQRRRRRTYLKESSSPPPRPHPHPLPSSLNSPQGAIEAIKAAYGVVLQILDPATPLSTLLKEL
ncbi:hypothetical protein Salat_1784000 [Sesamum alatum]|uniref:Uncharacterized protein n=1 Tax=Sesamum alatum TaxID=300844 RepID=A0AAE2CKV3_9LAMI|nr:hypothetical protein Salat_1784000 [Sesamum alatum]